MTREPVAIAAAIDGVIKAVVVALLALRVITAAEAAAIMGVETAVGAGAAAFVRSQVTPVKDPVIPVKVPPVPPTS